MFLHWVDVVFNSQCLQFDCPIILAWTPKRNRHSMAHKKKARKPVEKADKNQRVSPFRSVLGELNHFVFWPPFVFLLAVVVLNFTSPEQFNKLTTAAQSWILFNFGWLFSICAFACILICILVFFSKFADVRLGGVDAKPLMNRWNWFAITICTTIATGILFWATAEPLCHFGSPPPGLGIEPESPRAATFAISTMYLHWTFTPYAIYAVVSLTFAFAYYNMCKPFSLGSTVVPLLGDRATTGQMGNLIDAVCLYALVAGMAASLGTGIMAISGGLNLLFGLPSNQLAWAAIAIFIVGCFIVSSATGLMKGIRILSDLNVKALMCLVVIGFLFGPTVFIVNLGLESLGIYLSDFFAMNLFNGMVNERTAVESGEAASYWSHNWTLFYWAVWIAWAPISACFLGRIAYGRTVREFMMFNLVLPALFGMFWMAVFSGIALHMQMEGVADLFAILNGEGPNQGYAFVTFEVFKTFPLAQGVIAFYVISLFICFVTSADSNTSAMAAISSTGISPDNPEGNIVVKVLWGTTVGTVAWVMISFAKVDGVKIISTLGGFPAAILLVLIIGSLIKILLNHERLNVVDQQAKKKQS